MRFNWAFKGLMFKQYFPPKLIIVKFKHDICDYSCLNVRYLFYKTDDILESINF